MKKVRLLIQGEAPGREEVQKSKLQKPSKCNECPLLESGQGFVRKDSAFVGKAGQWLRFNILQQAGIQDDEVIFDNTIRCLLGGKSGGYPKGKNRKLAEEVCRHYDEWDKYPETPLLLAGQKAMAQYLNKATVGLYHGHIFRKDGRIVGCIYHPSAVMREPNLLPLTVQEVKNLMRAQANPALLERPIVWKGFIPDNLSGDFTFDLEYTDEKITIIGITDTRGVAYSKYADAADIQNFKERIQHASNNATGHAICTADLPVLGYTPEDIRRFAEQDKIFDTMIAAHLVHPHFAELGLLGLSDLVKYYDPTSEWKHEKSDMLYYNGLDVAYTQGLKEHLQRDLRRTGQSHLMVKDQSLAALTVEMHQTGVALDVEALEEYANQRQENRKKIEAEFPFNPKSWQQIKKWAKETLKVTLKDTKYETLVKYHGQHPMMDMLIEYKEDTKELETWFPMERDENGKMVVAERIIHPWLHVTGTRVARFSGSNPNTQNITVGGERILAGGIVKQMPNLRRFFSVRDANNEFFSIDFSQLEDWTVAFLSQDQQLLADLIGGKDIHRLTGATYASIIRGTHVDPATLSKDSPERYKGKQTNHQAKYLITPSYLAFRMFGNRKTHEVQEATTFLRAYFNRYKGVEAWQKKVAEQMADGDLRVRNPFGRSLRVYAAEERKFAKPFYAPVVTAHHEKTKRACHFLGCSTGAEILNQRALDVWIELGIAPVLIIHDECIWELPKTKEGQELKKQITEIFTRPVPELGGLTIPIGVKTGATYGSLEEVD